jgi:hypothetical protein
MYVRTIHMYHMYSADACSPSHSPHAAFIGFVDLGLPPSLAGFLAASTLPWARFQGLPCTTRSMQFMVQSVVQ